MDKEDFLWIIGLILCSPFIALYYIVKWLYQLTPWQIWKWIKRNREIHRLEEALNFRYDPYYYKNSERSYLDDLREKQRSNYKAPDIIVATLEEAAGKTLTFTELEIIWLPPAVIEAPGIVNVPSLFAINI